MSKYTPRHTTVAEVMRRNPVTADVTDSLAAVRDILRKEPFHHVPILDGDRLVGIISSRDLVRAYRPGADPDETPEPSTVAETMQTDLVTLRSDERVEKAIDLLADGAIHSVLVLDENDELVGITTNVDLLEYLFA